MPTSESKSKELKRRLQVRIKKLAQEYLLVPEHWTPKEKKLFYLRMTSLSYSFLKWFLVDKRLSYNEFYAMYWNQNITNTIPNPFAVKSRP